MMQAGYRTTALVQDIIPPRKASGRRSHVAFSSWMTYLLAVGNIDMDNAEWMAPRSGADHRGHRPERARYRQAPARIVHGRGSASDSRICLCLGLTLRLSLRRRGCDGLR